jgi:thymidine kinase
MYAGKTSKLMELYHASTEVKVMIDYDPIHSTGIVKNHDNLELPCEKTPRLLDVVKDKYKEIYINESQFFPDLVACIKEFPDINFYLGGLDGDFRREKFGQLLDIIPLCDTVVKLHAKCTCGKDAIFSHRITDHKEQYLPDEKCYVSLCRRCYARENKIENNAVYRCDRKIFDDVSYADCY